MSERPFRKTGWINFALGAFVEALGWMARAYATGAFKAVACVEIFGGAFLMLLGLALVVARKRQL